MNWGMTVLQTVALPLGDGSDSEQSHNMATRWREVLWLGLAACGGSGPPSTPGVTYIDAAPAPTSPLIYDTSLTNQISPTIEIPATTEGSTLLVEVVAPRTTWQGGMMRGGDTYLIYDAVLRPGDLQLALYESRNVAGGTTSLTLDIGDLPTPFSAHVIELVGDGNSGGLSNFANFSGTQSTAVAMPVPACPGDVVLSAFASSDDAGSKLDLVTAASTYGGSWPVNGAWETYTRSYHTGLSKPCN